MLTCHIGTRHLPGQIKHYVARSFRATIFNEPQLTTVGTAKGQPLAGCFWEQFASHCTNSTPNLLLKLSIAPEGMTFPLAEKLAVSHYISSDKPQQGQRDGWLSCSGRPAQKAQCQHLGCLLTDWPNRHCFDGSLHRITSHTLNSPISVHQNKWCHQISPHNCLLSVTLLVNFCVQPNDACPPSSVMMDGVISILVSTRNLRPKHMAWQMFQQWALFDLPCRCSLTLDFQERILIYKL